MSPVKISSPNREEGKPGSLLCLLTPIGARSACVGETKCVCVRERVRVAFGWFAIYKKKRKKTRVIIMHRSDIIAFHSGRWTDEGRKGNSFEKKKKKCVMRSGGGGCSSCPLLFTRAETIDERGERDTMTHLERICDSMSKRAGMATPYRFASMARFSAASLPGPCYYLSVVQI